LKLGGGRGKLRVVRETWPTEFSSVQIKTLRALVDRIIPADDFPSASQAGVLEYIQELLRRSDLRKPGDFLLGLSTVDFVALLEGARFVDLDNAGRDRVLRRLERHGMLHLRRFFKELIELTIEGYYADDSAAGTARPASWKMLGYDPRPTGGETA
jgi:hypothetical protein